MRPAPIGLPDGIRALHWAAPAEAPGVVIVHGYGSRKENHADFAELVAARGMAALALDLPGHGQSGGELGSGTLGSVVSAVDELSSRGYGPVALRGSSLGGFLALNAAARRAGVVRAVVALCPAQGPLLAERLGDPWPAALDTYAAVASPGIARGYWHAMADEVVPWPGTFRLAQLSPSPVRLRVSSGGHHRSLQHDPDVLAATVSFLEEHLGRG